MKVHSLVKNVVLSIIVIIIQMNLELINYRNKILNLIKLTTLI